MQRFAITSRKKHVLYYVIKKYFQMFTNNEFHNRKYKLKHYNCVKSLDLSLQYKEWASGH